MKIKDIMLFAPRAIYFFTIGKIPKIKLPMEAKKEIIEKGLYHFTPSEKISDEIIKSQYLKPSNFLNSYGRPCSFMFCGGPTIENYIKNISTTRNIVNPYTNPKMIQNAIKFTPSMEELKNYKYRGLTDEVITFRGYCNLKNEEVEKVKMVPDLIRDIDGNPLKNENGEYEVALREAKEYEINKENPNEYYAKQDYLDYMKEKAIKLGYLSKDGKPHSKLYNDLKTEIDIPRMEGEIFEKTISKNFLKKIKEMFYRIKIKKLPAAKVKEESDNFSQENKIEDEESLEFRKRIQVKSKENENEIAKCNEENKITKRRKELDNEERLQ